MPKSLRWTCLLLLLGPVFGCGGSEYASVEEPSSEIPEIEIDSLPADVFEAYETMVDRRMQAADTIAVDPEILRGLIPDSLAGYIREVDRAERFVTRDFTFSEGTKVFFEADGNDYIEFIAGDYVANPDFFEVVLQRYQLASGYELDGVTDRKAKLGTPEGAEAFIGWESYNRKKDLAEIHFAYDYRYFVSITATGQDSFLNKEQVAAWIDWENLP